jgi:hypothetical protein
MNQTRFRQVARLENLAEPYLDKRRREAEPLKFLLRSASVVVANVSLLILYGKPKIDEPLLTAWQRCFESDAWQACREEHGGHDEYGSDSATPFVAWGAMQIACYFRKHFLPDLPGAGEKEKLGAIFERAPPWLLWFTYCDVYADVLGIQLPDLSSVSRYARADPNFFFILPDGPFKCDLLPDGVYDKFNVPDHETIKNKEMDMSPRERKRMARLRVTQFS